MVESCAGSSRRVKTRVLLQVWRKEGKKKVVMVKFGKSENLLLDYLGKNGSITLSKFKKIAGISSSRAEAILSNLIIFRILKMNASEKGFSYELCLPNPSQPFPYCLRGPSVKK